jgi:hypothetical protein
MRLAQRLGGSVTHPPSMARGLYRYDRKPLRCAVRECRNTVAVHQDGCIMLHDHHWHLGIRIPCCLNRHPCLTRNPSRIADCAVKRLPLPAGSVLPRLVQCLTSMTASSQANRRACLRAHYTYKPHAATHDHCWSLVAGTLLTCYVAGQLCREKRSDATCSITRHTAMASEPENGQQVCVCVCGWGA